MMLIASDVRRSPIEGLGVFAVNHIKKGTLIWKFNPLIDQIITSSDLQTLPSRVREYVRHYSYKTDDVYVFCGDNGKYFNHSNSSNTKGLESKDGYGKTMALRDIKAGEELTCDYYDIDEDFKYKLIKYKKV